jgi:predicted dehydrogenase
LGRRENLREGNTAMAYRVIQVGTGGFGERWCRDFLPPNVRDGLIQVVAAVNRSPESLENARRYLGLTTDQCYTDTRRAFHENRADFCTIVVPPGSHEEIVDLALEHDLHILCEKPTANTLEAAVRIANKVTAAGKKMAVTLSHRFDQDKTSLREEYRTGGYGKLDYIICNHTVDRRKYGSWGQFRSEIPEVQMVEGGVHYLDILADLAGAHCDMLFAQSWNPPWSEFKGDPQALITMHFENSTRAFIEMAATNAVELYPWRNELWRMECELGTLILDHRELEVFTYDPEKFGNRVRKGEGRKVPLIEQPKWHNAWLVEKFVRWLDGGEPMETNVEDALQSVALFEAAIHSSRTGQPVAVQEYLRNVREQIG